MVGARVQRDREAQLCPRLLAAALAQQAAAERESRVVVGGVGLGHLTRLADGRHRGRSRSGCRGRGGRCRGCPVRPVVPPCGAGSRGWFGVLCCGQGPPSCHERGAGSDPEGCRADRFGVYPCGALPAVQRLPGSVEARFPPAGAPVVEVQALDVVGARQPGLHRVLEFRPVVSPGRCLQVVVLEGVRPQCGCQTKPGFWGSAGSARKVARVGVLCSVACSAAVSSFYGTATGGACGSAW